MFGTKPTRLMDKILISILDTKKLYCHSKQTSKLLISGHSFLPKRHKNRQSKSGGYHQCLASKLPSKRIPPRRFWFYSNMSERLGILHIIFFLCVGLRWETRLASRSELIAFMLQLKRNPVTSRAFRWLLAVDEWAAESILAGQLLCNGWVYIYRAGNWISVLHK